MDNIGVLNQLNNVFIEGNKYSGPNIPDTFVFYNYNTNVIITAPHSTRCYINNKEKLADIYTGPIVRYIGKNNEISHIVKTKHILKEEWISDYIIKNQLKDKYFIDFHGMHSGNNFHLAIGTGYLSESYYEKELSFIRKLADSLKIDFIVNHPNYTGKIGLTGRMQQYNKKCRCIQLEWRYDYRNFYENEENVMKKTIPFVIGLSNFLNEFKIGD